MSFDLSKAVLRPNEGEVLAVGPPDIGQIIIKVDPRNTGEARFAMGIQVLEREGVIPVHLHEGMEELIFGLTRNSVLVRPRGGGRRSRRMRRDG